MSSPSASRLRIGSASHPVFRRHHHRRRALGAFIDGQYELAGVDPRAIDTGALILTGVAVRRSNARAIGELFAAQAGKFVSVSAGDALEATLAAFGSGACARSIRESAVS